MGPAVFSVLISEYLSHFVAITRVEILLCEMDKYEKISVDKCKIITLSKNQARHREDGIQLLKPLLLSTVSGRLWQIQLEHKLNVLVLLKKPNTILDCMK